MSRSFDNRTWWCAQANHVFNCLGSTSEYEEYVFIDRVTDYIKVSGSKENIPSGYLFLCSFMDLRADASPIPFEVPDWAAYWSLDPTGVRRLNTGEAERLGFPSLTFNREISGFSWDGNVYAGLRQYHEAKGFDPDTQELARHLGFPLYKLFSGLDPPFSNITERTGRH
ncbi:hypothetical protein B0H14DRAFT_3882295 [Mycena olivaceomarginata]|nr:hypothetical protein B0H14DRAFT_3882295 [Mycena olivaceomarginata]